ncbi:unnamed protein product [Pedinophyceae sp. YPF-701]|nr:unnamed protein product [Pedinophyceae sp. YPF-701]
MSFAPSAFAGKAVVVAKPTARTGRTSVRVQAADRPVWFPGNEPAPHLDGSMPGDYGFDPLSLGSDPEYLKIWREAELQHARWAMLGAAGVLAQEIVKPDVNFYDAPTKIDLPFSIPTLIGIQFILMHYVEIRRWQDLRKPGSVNADPFNPKYKLPDHEPGYPGGIFAPFIPGDIETLKVKEIKNGRLAMLAFMGYIAAYLATGMGPLEALGAHMADPGKVNAFSYGAIPSPGSF